ncbi:hypothetical protein EHM69_03515 [candidate division KSB1 bacterium]|nr:MAG: hypothetical protein EHM69_03515 [candidate division KSB1 bacterium]
MLLRILFVLLALGAAFTVWAGAEINLFEVFPVLDHSQLEWTTGAEENIRTFVVERSTDGIAYLPIGQVTARGSYSRYQYTDSSPLDADHNRLFYYRLKIVERSGSFSYSDTREVSLSFSAVQHTWGSIKAMFR